MLFLLHFFRSEEFVGDDNPRVNRIRYGIDFIQTGLLGQAVGIVAVVSVPTPWVSAYWFCVVLLILSTVLLLVGTRRNAWMKGHSPRLGVMLGLLSLPGAVAVLLLKDRGSRTDMQRGFDVLLSQKVSGTWVTEESLTDPRLNPRPWGSDEDRAKLWRKPD